MTGSAAESFQVAGKSGVCGADFDYIAVIRSF